ncbi:MAG TPA: hypothetical protein VJQ59_05920 [Candidatus Sulfotelmatobacter sp.]|nr:hypothetical protein [Candidatus Sulfotelmatobacter sp.]
MNILYAQHSDGRKLYLPVFDSEGEVIPSGIPTAAITIDQNGVTFPPGSTWIRTDSLVGNFQPGWKIIGDVDAAPARRKSPRTRRTCQCGRTFLAKRADARWCSQACRSRASRSKNGQGDTDNHFGASVTDRAVNDLETVQNDENAGVVVDAIPALSVPQTAIPELSVSRTEA